MAEFSEPKPFSNLRAISSIDGRFRGNVEAFADYFSEYASMKLRVEIEIKYLIALMNFLEETRLTEKDKQKLQGVYKNFSDRDAQWIQSKDLVINHDTKSVEYFVRKQVEAQQLELQNYVHIGLTSADIDNNVLALSVMRFEQNSFSKLRNTILDNLASFINHNKDSLFLSKTHGKHAVPTTMAKEAEIFMHRLCKIDKEMQNHTFEGKLSGATGNFNAMCAAYPDWDWRNFSEKFIKSLGLCPNLYTTQILPYDNLIRYLNLVALFNAILIDLARDFWFYISLELLSLEFNENEVGSSTMPHKVNPISFEGAEAYLLISNNLISFFSSELATNRLQRDLTDKYISREIGVSLVQSALGYSMIAGGLGRVKFNNDTAEKEMGQHWEILGEAIQTILRKEGYPESYETIKELTMGKKLTKSDFLAMINKLHGVPEDLKDQLRKLSQKNYQGWAQSSK